MDYTITVWNKKDAARDICLDVTSPDTIITNFDNKVVSLDPESQKVITLSVRSEVVADQVPVVVTASSGDDQDSITLKTSFIAPLAVSVDSTGKAVHTGENAVYTINVQNTGV